VPAQLALESPKPTVPVKITNTTGRPGRVTGWLEGEPATVTAPDHSAVVTLSWDSPSLVRGGQALLRLELYSDLDPQRPVDVEEHWFSVRSGYGQGPLPSHSPRPSHSLKPSPSVSPSPSPSIVASEVAPESSPPSGAPGLAPTGGELALYGVLGGSLLAFGLLMLGRSWMRRGGRRAVGAHRRGVKRTFPSAWTAVPVTLKKSEREKAVPSE